MKAMCMKIENQDEDQDGDVMRWRRFFRPITYSVPVENAFDPPPKELFDQIVYFKW
jgi:hypothetical protein